VIWVLLLSLIAVTLGVFGLYRRTEQIERDVSRLWQREHNRTAVTRRAVEEQLLATAPKASTPNVVYVGQTNSAAGKPTASRKKAAAK